MRKELDPGMKHITIIRFFAFLTFLLINTAPSLAQQAPASRPSGWSSPDFAIPGVKDTTSTTTYRDADPLKNPVFLKLPRNLQDELLAEADKYHNECSLNTTYAQKHDCNCLSIHFMNERLKNGPDKSSDTINADIMEDCVDTASTAGAAYDKCMRLYQEMYPNNTKALCECFARRFALKYAKKPIANSDYEMNLSMQSLTECRSLTDPNGAITPYEKTESPPAAQTDLMNLKP
jgi:hypothetical protein